jgi:multicomponent K+:H+ antiporter subunit D
VLFLCLAVGAAGLPPLSGFLGKAMILAAAPIAQARTLWPAVLVSGLLLIVALSRTGTRLFWAIPASEAYAAAPHAAPHGARKKLAACALLLACVIAATLGAGPLKRWLDASAAQLLDRAAYVHAVLRAPANG